MHAVLEMTVERSVVANGLPSVRAREVGEAGRTRKLVCRIAAAAASKWPHDPISL
jgi:hypothetical protein